MNLKSTIVLLILIGLAVLFVPLIPNDTPIECTGNMEMCDESAGYISIYSKYFSK